MNILLGYIPTPEGLAALDWATEHASLTREIGADLDSPCPVVAVKGNR